MKPSQRHIHLGMFETAELIRELSNRENLELLVAVRFVDGSSNADVDTIYLSATLDGVDSLAAFEEAISEYVEEIRLGRCEYEEDDDE